MTAVSLGYAQSAPTTPVTASLTTTTPLVQITAPQPYTGMSFNLGAGGTFTGGEEGSAGLGGQIQMGDGRIQSETPVMGLIDAPNGASVSWTLYLRPVDTNSTTFSKSDIVLG